MPATEFETKRYVIIHSLVPKEICEKISEYASKLTDGVNDTQCPKSKAWYGDRVMESLMVDILPRMESITGKKLYPTYAYFRIYRTGDILAHHTDRPSCEISVTLTLSKGTGDIWPIYIQKEGSEPTKAILDVGDGLVYHGCECDHWREKYVEGDGQIQVFMHYVDANGPFAEYKYDKRTSLNVVSRN